MVHYISFNLLEGIHYTDIPSKSKANTCKKKLMDFGPGACFYSNKTAHLRMGPVNQCKLRLIEATRCSKRKSALSTFDGRIEDRHGCDG